MDYGDANDASYELVPLYHNFLTGYSSLRHPLHLELDDATRGRVLYCEAPGAGKTLTALATIAEMAKRKPQRDAPTQGSSRTRHCSLVVTRPELLMQWMETAVRFLPADGSICVRLLTPNKKKRVAELALRLVGSVLNSGSIDPAWIKLVRVIWEEKQLPTSSSSSSSSDSTSTLCITDWSTFLNAKLQHPWQCVVTDEGQLIRDQNKCRMLVQALAAFGTRPHLRMALTGTPLNNAKLDDLIFLLGSLCVPYLCEDEWTRRNTLLPLLLEDATLGSVGARGFLLSFMSHLAFKHDDRDVDFPRQDERSIICSSPSAVEHALQRLLVWTGADSETRQLAASHPALALWTDEMAKYIQHAEGGKTAKDSKEERRMTRSELKENVAKKTLELMNDSKVASEVKRQLEQQKQQRCAELAKTFFTAADIYASGKGEHSIQQSAAIPSSSSSSTFPDLHLHLAYAEYEALESLQHQLNFTLSEEDQMRWLAGSASILLRIAQGTSTVRARQRKE